VTHLTDAIGFGFAKIVDCRLNFTQQRVKLNVSVSVADGRFQALSPVD
jgi:hypothetical protein